MVSSIQLHIPMLPIIDQIVDPHHVAMISLPVWNPEKNQAPLITYFS